MNDGNKNHIGAENKFCNYDKCSIFIQIQDEPPPN